MKMPGWQKNENPLGYHGEWSFSEGHATKNPLVLPPSDVGLRTFLGTPFTMIPPRLLHTLSHYLFSIVQLWLSNVNFHCPMLVFHCLIYVFHCPISVFYYLMLVFHFLMLPFNCPMMIFHRPMWVFHCSMLVFGNFLLVAPLTPPPPTTRKSVEKSYSQETFQRFSKRGGGG